MAAGRGEGLRFVALDVFADAPFRGNPLAVIPDARGLDAAAMQAVAAEFNHSETAFVLPPEDPAHTARVRIFTPRSEVPWAGHPNVGTAFALAALGIARGTSLVFEEKAGLVPVDLAFEAGRPVGATVTAPRDLARSGPLPVEAVAAAIGLSPADVSVAAHPPLLVSVGLPFVLVELNGLDALGRASPDLAATRALLLQDGPLDGADAVHAYVRTGPGTARARMFAPLDGVPEDPATGSANAALAALLASLAPEPDLSLRLEVDQGVEMGRPSRLSLAVDKRAGRVGRVRVGGRCVVVMEGRLWTGAPGS
jgi:trans-2,3-dihydro-3-hydroxyanthranilate isomerase